MNRLTQYKIKRGVGKFLIGLAVLLSVLLVGTGILFGINRFSYVIVPIGGETVEVHYGESYVEQGAELRLRGLLFFKEGFLLDEEVSSEGSVDTQVVGSYAVTYRVSYRGKEIIGTRTVNVVDKKPPVITLNKIPDHFTVPGEAYSEEGFSAVDEYDGDLTHLVTAVEADGVVTYTVSDASGNVATLQREIFYFDPTPPEITLLGDAITAYAGEDYDEPGFTAWDNCAGDITNRVQISTDWIKYLAGTYRITYTVTDDYGNIASAQRSITVLPKSQPETEMPKGKVIYLTFDDGPSEYTRTLLEILKRNEVQATFFVCGTDHIELITEIVEQGHSIAVHSKTHTYELVYESVDSYFEDMLWMRTKIHELTGVETNLIRFPGGSSNTVSKFNPGIMTMLTQAVRDCGYEYFDWNVDSDDAGEATTADEVYRNVVVGIPWAMEHYGFAIVLQHDTQNFSIDAVERIIKWGKENGYIFLPLEYDSPTVHHRVVN